MSKNIFALAGILLILASCNSKKQQVVRLFGEAQGSTYSVIYADKEQRNFQAAIDSLLRVIDKSMSTYDSTSIISAVNKGLDVNLDNHFLKVWAKSAEIFEQSGGVFDATIAPLVNAWGFGYKQGLEHLDSITVDSLRQLIGTEKVMLESNKLKFQKEGMQLDFNAIAQGYTVDVLSELLESNGINQYMIELGGEVLTKGKNAEGKDWRIGIDKPVAFSENRPLQVILKLSDKALATSGSYRKFKEIGGRKVSHAIDPRNGYPVTHNVLSVSVLADDCMSADAWATTFLILGLEESKKLLKDLPLEAYFIFSDKEGALHVEMTPGFQKYILEDVFE
jgi:thiamine biosynthesis lipoprotein